MKTALLLKNRSERGSVLAMALIFAVLCGVTLGSYMTLIGSDNKSISRSQSWNCALAYAEAGVDEALAQINASPSDFSANSWGGSGGTFGPVTRSMNNGYYTVSVVGGPVPAIYSTGFVYVAATSGQVVSRRVKVTARQLGLFPVAFAAVNYIQMNGSGPASDSYNSHNPNLSNNGVFDPTKTSTNGNVAIQSGTINLGNHSIIGNLYIGPTAVSSVSPSQVTGQIFTDYNVQFPTVTLPTPTQGFWTVAVPVTTTTYITNISKKGVITITPKTSAPEYHFTTSGDYQITSGNYPIEVDANVSVRLNVTASSFAPASLQIHDNGDINQSGTAYVYFNGPTSVSIAGNTAVDASLRPENLWYYGLPSLQSITFSGTSTFIGVIYAPDANLTLNGGGNNNGLIGSSITEAITMNGHYNFHYDEYLSTLGSRGFIPESWQEL